MLKRLYETYIKSLLGLEKDLSAEQLPENEPVQRKSWLDVIDGRKIAHGCSVNIDNPKKQTYGIIRKLHYFMLFADDKKESVTIKILSDDLREIRYTDSVLPFEIGKESYGKLSDAIHSGKYSIIQLNGSLRMAIFGDEKNMK